MRADARRHPGQVYDLTFVEQFSYTQAGLPTKKLWTMTKPFTGTGSLEALYSYDKGRRTEMTYPTALGPGGVEPGRVFAYQYDTMGRPSGMTQDVWTTWVSGITYNPAGQMTAMSYVNGGESRTYNTLGQMTNLVSGNVNLEYRFHATQNNGRITSMKDNVSGEEVNYAYDSLNRLLTAATTGPEWGLSFAYDGFGNKTGQTVTKGTGPALSIGADPATNRVGSTDANGNLLTGGNNWCATADCYDVANRMVLTNGGPIGIGYAPDNKRVYERRWVSEDVYEDRVMFYGVDGMRLGVYKAEPGAPNVIDFRKVTESVYYGSKLIWQNGERIVTDRLGSVVQRGATRLTYYPYGEEKPGATGPDKEKFGTYYRDSVTGLDYADQRYFHHQWGRFTSPDPYKASASTTNPGSWNRYAYVTGDPVNHKDSSGLDEHSPDGMRYCHATGEAYYPEYFDLNCPRPNPHDFNPGCQPGTQLPPCDPDEAVFVKPKVPPGNKYTVAQMTALTYGLNEAILRIQSFECFSLFTSEPDAGAYLTGILAN